MILVNNLFEKRISFAIISPLFSSYFILYATLEAFTLYTTQNNDRSADGIKAAIFHFKSVQVFINLSSEKIK